MKISFTKRSISQLVCSSAQGRVFVRDTTCRGLCIEVRSTGGKTYYLSYRDARGAQRLHKLANAADVSPQDARVLCDRARNSIAMGVDPTEQRAQLKKSITVAEFYNTSYLPYIKSYKRSWSTDHSVFVNHILPVIGKDHINAVTAERVAAVIDTASVRLSAATLNKLLVLMRYMFNLAIRWNTAGVVSNPTAQHKFKRLSNHRERFLTAEETQQLIAAVNASSNTQLRYIVPFLLLTGARKREVLDARWRDVDFERSFWRIPITKSGRERHVPLSAAAVVLLKSMQAQRACEWIFVNPKTLKPFVSVFFSWNAARTAAGLADVRMHDLRHSFASFLVNAGCSLYEVQKILGHASSAMTQRYSHLSQDALLRAVSHAGAVVTAHTQA